MKQSPDSARVDVLLRKPELFVKIWKHYGRRQFEDSLIYLYSNFEAKENERNRQDFRRKLFQTAIYDGVIGLLAYACGYAITGYDSVIMQYKLTPLQTPGLIYLDDKTLAGYRGDGVEAIDATQNSPDVDRLFLHLMELRGIPTPK